MTTFRNEPTTSPNTRHSHGNTVGWAAALRIPLIGSNKKGYGWTVTPSPRCAMGIMLDRLADLEDRQGHRHQHGAAQHAEDHHDHRVHHTGERVHPASLGALTHRHTPPAATEAGGEYDLQLIDEKVRHPPDEEGGGGERAAKAAHPVLDCANKKKHHNRVEKDPYSAFLPPALEQP